MAMTYHSTLPEVALSREFDPIRRAHFFSTLLEGCRWELREALSDWIALRLRLGLSIPVVAGLDLNRILQPA
jgi:hypothetical protein